MRELIRGCDPGIVEEWKWRGVPVWEHHGILCAGETYKNYVKLTFAKGAALPDPAGLFNSSLEGNTRRAIDIRDGDVLDKAAFAALILALANSDPADSTLADYLMAGVFIPIGLAGAIGPFIAARRRRQAPDPPT